MSAEAGALARVVGASCRAVSDAMFMRQCASRGESPCLLFAGAQRPEFLFAIGEALGNLPGAFDEPDALLVPRQAVKIRPEFRGKTFQARQGAGGCEDLRVQFDARVAGKNPGAAAGAFLRRARVWCTVCAEEEFGIAAGRGADERAAILLRLQDRQAVVMRTDAACEQRIAIQEEMLRRDRRHDPGARRGYELHSCAARHVLEHDAQFREALSQRREYRVDEARLAVKYINARVRDLAVPLQDEAHFAP